MLLRASLICMAVIWHSVCQVYSFQSKNLMVWKQSPEPPPVLCQNCWHLFQRATYKLSSETASIPQEQHPVRQFQVWKCLCPSYLCIVNLNWHTQPIALEKLVNRNLCISQPDSWEFTNLWTHTRVVSNFSLCQLDDVRACGLGGQRALIIRILGRIVKRGIVKNSDIYRKNISIKHCKEVRFHTFPHHIVTYGCAGLHNQTYNWNVPMHTLTHTSRTTSACTLLNPVTSFLFLARSPQRNLIHLTLLFAAGPHDHQWCKQSTAEMEGLICLNNPLPRFLLCFGTRFLDGTVESKRPPTYEPDQHS